MEYKFLDLDYKFLDKVLGQILSETGVIEYHGDIFLNYPFTTHRGINIHLPVPFGELSDHCRNVYGLSDDESDHVYHEYNDTIRNKYNKDNNYGGKLRKSK